MAGKPPSGEADLLETNSMWIGRSRLVMAGIEKRRTRRRFVQFYRIFSPKGESTPLQANDWGGNSRSRCGKFLVPRIARSVKIVDQCARTFAGSIAALFFQEFLDIFVELDRH